MPTDTEIANALDSLHSDGQALLQLALDPRKRDAFSAAYQGWYSRALKLAQLLGPDRADEFVAYYRADARRKLTNKDTYVIQDFLNGLEAHIDSRGRPYFDIHGVVITRLKNQLHIIESLRSRVGSVLADLRGQLLADLQDSELQTATRLLSVSLRAAGAVAGVVLEGHLQRIAATHHVTIAKRNPAISDLNEPLRAAGVYDVPTWRRIQHLADIRNYCDHKKEREPTEAEVQDLITGTSAIVRTVF